MFGGAGRPAEGSQDSGPDELPPTHPQQQYSPGDHIAAFLPPLLGMDKCFPGRWVLTHQFRNHCRNQIYKIQVFESYQSC